MLECLASHHTSAASKPTRLSPSTGYHCILSVITGLSLDDTGGLFLVCPSHRDERSQSSAGSQRSPTARCCKTCVRWSALKTQPRRRAGAARGRGRGQERWEAALAVLGSTLSLAGRLVTQPAGKTHRSQVRYYIKHIVSVSSRLVNALC